MLDIGQLLFVDLLKMTIYPGSPFTGEIIQDLAMFFFVPSVFIILIIYQTIGRLFSTSKAKMRILIGISIYLVIIFQGFYSVFAYLAGPYFLFLIFVYGLFMFAIEHVPIARQESDLIEIAGAAPFGEESALSRSRGGRGGPAEVFNSVLKQRGIKIHDRRRLEKEIKNIEETLQDKRIDVTGAELMHLKQYRDMLREKAYGKDAA